MLDTLPNSNEIARLIERGALFVINHSGGKDSQAMTAVLRAIVPAAQLLAIHATLPGMEWEGTYEHIEATTQGLELKKCQAVKTFEEMVERRYEKRPDVPNFPSPQYRQCTSDLKRGPIDKEIRAHMKLHSLNLVVSCTGIRAEESTSRAKAKTLTINKRNSKDVSRQLPEGREWYDWLPIHDYLVGEVWACIEAAGQKRHWAYDVGASRLSCALCIMSSKADLEIGAKYNPKTFEMLAKLEERTNCTMMMPKKGGRTKTLRDIIKGETK